MLRPEVVALSILLWQTNTSHINDNYLGLKILASDLVGHEPLFAERPATCPTRPHQFSSLRVVLLVLQVIFPLQRALRPHLALR